MIGFVVRRVAGALLVLLGALTIIFVVVRIVPGDPATLILGPGATPAEVASLRASLRLDEPLWQQYLSFLGGAARLDFGPSYRLGSSAMSQVLDRLPATLELAGVALLIVLAIGIPLGVAAGRHAGGWRDRAVSAIAMLGQAVPAFWVGVMLILVFSGWLRLLPSGGRGTLAQLVLPSVTLAVTFLGMVTKLVRSGVVEQLREGYVQTARAKGASPSRVLYGHVVRNSLIPVITVVGLITGVFIGNAVVVETVFAWPGVGRLLIDSILYRDYPVVQAAVAVLAVVYLVLNTAVDLLYGVVDPRVSIVGAR